MPRGTTPPELLPRAGLGTAADRPNILPPLSPSYGETFYLGLSVAAGAVEFASTRLLHQPFRVVRVSVAHGIAFTSDIRLILFHANTDLTGAAAADLIRHGLVSGGFEDLQGDQGRWTSTGAIIPVTRDVLDVPTRLHLLVDNQSAAAFIPAVLVAVVYLTPTPPPARTPPTTLAP